MRRWTLGLLLSSLGLLSCVNETQAARWQRSESPPRYRLGSYATYIVRPRDGQPTVRKVYNGYESGFPPPAFLYYGYPHGKDARGFGFNDGLSPGF